MKEETKKKLSITKFSPREFKNFEVVLIGTFSDNEKSNIENKFTDCLAMDLHAIAIFLITEFTDYRFSFIGETLITIEKR